MAVIGITLSSDLAAQKGRPAHIHGTNNKLGGHPVWTLCGVLVIEVTDLPWSTDMKEACQRCAKAYRRVGSLR